MPAWLKALNPIKLVQMIAKPLTDYLSHNMKMKELRRKSERTIAEKKVDAVIQAKATLQENDNSYNVAALKNSGWKDEWLTIILSLPLVGSFIPGIAPYILEGFTILDQTPAWYKAAIALMISAVFGQVSYYRNRESALRLKQIKETKDKENDNS